MAVKVLLVDDDKSYYTMTSHILSRTNEEYELDWIEDYTKGRETILKGEHDVYLIDYFLGEHNGLELLKEVMAQSITSPIIIMTGKGGEDIDLKVIQAGASDYIDKAELKPVILQRAIRHALERKRFMQQIKANQDSYRILLEEASDGIFIMDRHGKLVLVNARACEMLGYKEAELLGLNIRDVMDSDDPNADGAQTISRKRKLTERSMKKSDGSMLDVEISSRIIDGNQIQFIARDITERNNARKERDQHIEQLTILRQIDNELTEMLNTNYVLSLGLDAAMRLSGANAGFIGIKEEGEIRVAQVLGNYKETISTDSLKKNPLIVKLLAEENPRCIPDVTKEPEYVAMVEKTKALMLFPLMSFERLIGILVLETDKPERFAEQVFEFAKIITARVAVSVENAQLYQIAQDQLAQLQDLYAQVSDLERLKTDMIRIAAHDLRNPVGVIVGYAQLLERELGEALNDKRKRYLTSIESAAKRMEKITTDILSLERIENIQSDKRDSLNLATLVKEVYEELQNQAQAKNQTYEINLPEETIMIQADSPQLVEAVNNLIGNAIKYTPENGTVTINVVKEEGYGVFKVVDTGYGIPEAQQMGLFQPFFRAKSQETSDIDGTGLGLHLVKNIVERFDGDIIFSSTYGEGSTFGFKLPL